MNEKPIYDAELAFMELRARLEGRQKSNEESASVHPMLETRLQAQGRASGYKTAIEDLDAFKARLLASQQLRSVLLRDKQHR